MAYYPKIAEIKFQTRFIKINIPIRLKLFSMDVYTCSYCDLNMSHRQIDSYIHKNWDKISRMVRNQERDASNVGIHIIESDGVINCPDCFLRTGKLARLNKNVKKRLKLMINSTQPYMDVQRLVSDFTSLHPKIDSIYCGARSNSKAISSIHHKYRYSCIYKIENMDEMYKAIDWFNNDGSQSLVRKKAEKNGLKVEVNIIYKPTLEELEKIHEKYQMRRTIRKI